MKERRMGKRRKHNIGWWMSDGKKTIFIAGRRSKDRRQG